LFDESEDAAHNKHLKMIVKYFSESLNGVFYSHLSTKFITKGNATTIVEAIILSVESELRLENLIMLGSDVTNVNKTVKKLFNERLDKKNMILLLDPGSCHNHKIHNSFKYACKTLGVKTQHLLRYLDSYFDSTTNWNVRYLKKIF
jgi:hypothetical protein